MVKAFNCTKYGDRNKHYCVKIETISGIDYESDFVYNENERDKCIKRLIGDNTYDDDSDED